jgi:hypothetical protein
VKVMCSLAERRDIGKQIIRHHNKNL